MIKDMIVTVVVRILRWRQLLKIVVRAIVGDIDWAGEATTGPTQLIWIIPVLSHEWWALLAPKVLLDFVVGIALLALGIGSCLGWCSSRQQASRHTIIMSLFHVAIAEDVAIVLDDCLMMLMVMVLWWSSRRLLLLHLVCVKVAGLKRLIAVVLLLRDYVQLQLQVFGGFKRPGPTYCPDLIDCLRCNSVVVVAKANGGFCCLLLFEPTWKCVVLTW